MAWAAVFVLSGMGLSKIMATEPDLSSETFPDVVRIQE